MILILLLVFVLTIIYYKGIKPFTYWTDRGIKQRKQTYFLGDFADIALKRGTVFDMAINIYNAFPEERYIGMYQMAIPSLAVRDPELIKRITVKDADHFVDHRTFIPDDVEPLFNRNLFALKGDKWHDMRSTLSPSFTSSKMKMMFSLISECAVTFTEHFLEMNDDTTSLELKDAFARYTNDVIATSAFGVKCNSVKERDNEFYTMVQKATNYTGFWTNFQLFVLQISPAIFKAFRMQVLDQDAANFFKKIVSETIATREKNGIIRPDMLHLLMEARKKNEEHKNDKFVPKEEISTLDITAQVLIFFFGGFETVSTVMCFAGYELAIRPEIQRKLQEEIDATLKNCEGELTYDALIKMRYMDMVVSEILRFYAPPGSTDRVCVKPYTIEPVKEGEKPVHLKIGDVVWIPIAGFHKDPKYFPNPAVFDPERFNEENKRSIQPYTYFPFGLGPRNCIGSRFALMEIKALFFHLLSKFDLVPVEKTQIPMRLKNGPAIVAENGFWIGLKRRRSTVI